MKKKIIRSLFAILLLTGSMTGLAQVPAAALQLYNEGIKLKDNRQTAEALDKFKKAIAIKANYTDALYNAGWCQNELAKYNSAIDYLNKARVGWPDIPKVYFELGFAFYKLGNNDSARIHFNRCLELKKDYSLAFKQLGYIDYDEEKYSSAIRQFNQYEASAKDEIKDYLYWYRKGFSHNALKEYEQAINRLNRSLEYKKDFLNTFLELGFANTKLKRNEEAIAQFKKAMEIDPKSHIPYNGIAEVYRDNIKDCDQAMEWYRKTLGVKTNERKANFGLGYCSNSKGEYSAAINYLKKAVEAETTYTAAFVELGFAYYKTGGFSDAEYHFNKAISLSPNNENARYYACLMYVQQKDKYKAQKMLDELKQLNSKHVEKLQPKVNAL
ncbi:MAG: tetratricopeptide repeat protein [Chitinophagaceae bacterium]|nr:tetratricopeptide repeat protein [Chitinophagaceae bacterium]